MAKDRKKLQHIHSSIPDKQPTAASLEIGEIAVNNAANQEFLSLKNSNDKVVRFSSDEQIVTIMEKKEVMPYNGFVRGETGPTGTVDELGSYGITENDLLNNTSNIVVKLNQVAAGNTVKHSDVNGAKDRYGKCVNPTTDDGLTDGAGFYIDMSRYAMQGANPTFSGITNTCYTELNGRTEILGGDATEGSCRSLLNIDVLSATTNASSAWTTVGTAETKVTSANTTIGTDILRVSGTTTETHVGNVTINNNANVTETTTGNVITNVSGSTTADTGGNVVVLTSGTTIETKKGDVTENNQSNFVGNTTGTTTEIKIGDVAEYHSGTTTETKKGVVTENNQSDFIGNTTGTTKEIKIGNVEEWHSGTTTETKKGLVTENNLDSKVENTTKNVTANTTGNVVTNTSGTTTETKKENVTENNLANKAENTTGNVLNNTTGTTTENLSKNWTVNVATGGTDINSCEYIHLTTDDFKVSQCNGNGSAEFDFCNKFDVNSDSVNITECETGTITIKETDTIISGTNISITELGNSTTNVGGNVIENTTGNVVTNTSGTTTETKKGLVTENNLNNKIENTTGNFTGNTTGTTTEIKIGNVEEYHSGATTETKKGAVIENNLVSKTENTIGINTVNNSNDYIINTTGKTELTSTGDTNIHSDANICETADVNATFYGAVKTNVGLNCTDDASATTTNVYGKTLNVSASTANTNIGTANTTISTANTTIGTATTNITNANTTIGTATTVITQANTTATTATLNGNTLVVEEATSISAKTPSTYISGTSLDIKETNTDITSCGHIYLNTNDFKLKQCDGTDGSAELKFCNSFKVESSDITFEQCDPNGKITITEKNSTINGENLAINESGDTTINTGDELTVKTSGNTLVNTTGNTTLTTTGTTTIKSTGNGSDVCISAADEAALYGANATKVGSSCDGSVTKTATVQSSGITNIYGPTTNISGTTNNNTFTTVNTTANTINQSGTTYNVTANTETHNSSSFTVNSTASCIVASDTASIGGDVTTNVGANCNGNAISNTTNIYGNEVNVTGDTVNITGDTNITGDVYITGEITIGTQCSELTSTTIDDSFCEVFDRSKITMTRESDPSDTRLSAIYRLWQDGAQIGYDINVPKDGFLKNVELVNVDNIYYLRFTWNIYDSDTGTYRTGTTDVNVEDLVKDIDENNSNTDRGVNVDVWYNETTKKMNVSATTKITVNAPSGNKQFTRANGEHTLNSYKLTATAGTFSEMSFDPFNENATISVPTDASHISRKTLKVTHNGLTDTYDPASGATWTLPHSSLTATYEATSGKSGTVTFNTSAGKSISIPTCVNHLNRHTIKFQSGDVKTFSAQTYDPGKDCANTAETLNIPVSIDNLTNWNGTCISLPHNTCITGKLEVSNGVYNTSDERLKEAINEADFAKTIRANEVPIKEFAYKSDSTKRKVYGVIAQEVQDKGLHELIYENEEGYLSVDYTSLMILKIAFLENEVKRLNSKLEQVLEKLGDKE